MKKIILFLLLVSTCFLFIGCDEEPVVETHNVTFVNELTNNNQVKSGVKGTIVSVVRENVDGYDFEGWSDGNSYVMMPYEIGDSDVTLYAKYTAKSYTITFNDEDGTLLEIVSVKYGEIPSISTTPTKEATESTIYTFNGWDKELVKVTKDETYTATYKAETKQVTYTFYDEDGTTILKQDKVDYGKVPTAPADPTKNSDETYNYTFNGWDKKVSAITSDTTYTATYKATKIQTTFTSLENVKFSVLGDSISTFYVEGSLYNSYYSASGTYYYPTYCSSVDTWDKTWWGTLLNNTGMQLGINNSWSGSRAAGSGSNAGCTDGRINTLDDNGTPDILLVYLGTNDCAGGEATSIFKDAIITIINKAKALGINQIYLTTLGYSAYKGSSYKDETRVDYNKTLRELAEEYKCGIVPLDDYITDESYSFYLNDNLHYNPKGAALLAEIFEKSILEYNGLTYTKTITIEKKEKLPEGVLGTATATADAGFWDNKGYESNVYFFDVTTSPTNPTFSLRIELTKNNDNGKYYVSKISKSGATEAYSGDYVLCISSANTSYNAILADLENVEVGSIAEFDLAGGFPMTITFKEGDGEDGGEGGQGENVPVIDSNGVIHVSNYNKNVFATYETEIFIYASTSAGIGGNSYKNFGVIGLVADGENYKIVSMKDVGTAFTSIDEVNGASYILLIYSSCDAFSFYENASLNAHVKVTGAIDSGDCKLELLD